MHNETRLQQVHIMRHSMVKNHNYGNTYLLNGEIEERKGCQCSQKHPFFARMCENHYALFKHKTRKLYLFILFLFRGTEVFQRNFYTVRKRGCFVSLSQVVSEDVISNSSDLSGKENITNQRPFQREFHSPDSIRSVSVW